MSAGGFGHGEILINAHHLFIAQTLGVRGCLRSSQRQVGATFDDGVYKVGFATTQQAYEKSFRSLFAALDSLDARLATQRYLVGSQITEADWRLFTTLVRFDSVYHGHFKTNLKRIEDYPNLPNYLRDLFQQPDVADTVNFDHIKTHYYFSHDTINPTRVVPLWPEIDYDTAHNRDRF